MKQTAVEWLHEMLRDSSKEVFDGNIWDQAKEMEKEQIKDAYEKGKKYKKPIKDSNPIWLNSKPYTTKLLNQNKMKAKLIKTEVNYILEDDKGVVIASTSLKKDGLVLSLKNCQAIEQDSPLQEYVLEVNGEGWDDHLYRGSRKQTEWDVEVEMECVMGCQNLILNGENSVCCGDKKPKLDADGCLILKTFKSE